MTIDNIDFDALLNTPPTIGVDVVQEIQNNLIREQDRFIAQACVRVGVDPDALRRTGQKNAELMEALVETRRQLSAALYHVERYKRGTKSALLAMAHAILDEIEAALRSNYAARRERIEKGHTSDDFLSVIEGKIAALRGMQGFVEELLDKMLTELEKEV